MLTAYDHPTALLLDEAGIDCLLVGDSLGMVVQGQPDALGVTLDQMIYHGRMVARAAKRALVIVDMPFLSYQVNDDEAVRNAGRILQETGAHAVKLEGGRRNVAAIRRMVDAGIPVMGHVGLTPQSVRRLGGFKVQRDADGLLADAKAVEEVAGAPAGSLAKILDETGDIGLAVEELLESERPIAGEAAASEERHAQVRSSAIASATGVMPVSERRLRADPPLTP